MSSNYPGNRLSEDDQLVRQIARFLELYPQYVPSLVVQLAYGNQPSALVRPLFLR